MIIYDEPYKWKKNYYGYEDINDFFLFTIAHFCKGKKITIIDIYKYLNNNPEDYIFKQFDYDEVLPEDCEYKRADMLLAYQLGKKIAKYLKEIYE